MADRTSQQPRDVGARGGDPARLVADLLAAEGPPRTGALGAQAGGIDMTAADAVEQEVEREEQILRRRRAEAMRERHVTADGHARAAKPDRDAEAVTAARDGDALQREGGERGVLGQRAPVAAFAARLDRLGAGRHRAVAGGEEAGLDHRVGIKHQDRVPLQRTRVLEPRLPRCRPAWGLIWAALEHGRAERARDFGGPIGAAVGDDQHQVVRSPVGHDRVEGGGDHHLLVVGRHQHDEAELGLVGGPGIPIEPGRERKQTEVSRADEPGEAEQNRHRDDECFDVHGRPFP